MTNVPTRRILVSIPTSLHTQRQKLAGILQYAREKHGDRWRIQLDMGGFIRQRLKDFSGWKCDGIIAYIDDPTQRKRFLSTGIPTILIEPFLSPQSKIDKRPKTVTFINDHAREGRTAAEHFLSRHFRSFAFVGTPETTPWSTLRGKGFAERLAAAGMTCRHYPHLSKAEREDFACEMPRLVDWLRKLPRPTAVFAAHDIRARQILIAADAAGIDIPNHIAVLGVDDDDLICETATPSLSSIPAGDISLGFACGRALEELFKGHPGGKTIISSHTRVICRASTDLNAVRDPFVARALDWARKHLSDGASVESIAKGIGYSKRMLQARARNALGRPLGEEVRNIMLETASELLINTDKPVSEIAAECGYSSVSHLSQVFKKAYRMTPLSYRHTSPLDLRGKKLYNSH